MAEQRKQSIGIKQTLTLISKSKDPLSPMTEALMNSLDAIKQRQQTGEDFVPEIDVELNFIRSDLFDKPEVLDFIRVSDNGIGFSEENENRLLALGDRSKGFNNRGTGKAQIFHRFSTLDVSSIVKVGDAFIEKDISYDINDNYHSTQKKASCCGLKTIVTMKDFYADKAEMEYWQNFRTSSSNLKKEIIRHLFLRLFMERDTNLSIRVSIFRQDSGTPSTFVISGKDIPDPEKTEDAIVESVKYNSKKKGVEWEVVQPHTLKIRRFKMPVEDATGNAIYLCSKNILVKPFPLPLLRKNTNYSGFYYLTSISGDIFDEPSNVSQTVDDFIFPSRKKIEQDIENGEMYYSEQPFIFREDIKKSLSESLAAVYSDVKSLKDDQEKSILAIAQKYGIHDDAVTVSKVYINDSSEEITQKLFAAQAKIFAKRSIEIQQSFDEIAKFESESANPLSEDYEAKIGEATRKLLSLIPQQNKDELARYVIRRDMVVKILQLIEGNKSAQQILWKQLKESGIDVREDKEGLIHDLIFKRKHLSTCANDLWLLNEEFVHFSGCSDKPIEELEVNGEKLLKDDIDIENILVKFGLQKGSVLEKRPDIFLFPEEGKCILIEFKALGVDVTKHLDQIAMYAKLIANFSRYKISQFYGYFFCETVNTLTINGRYRLASYGNYWVYPYEPVVDVGTQAPIADLYQEIIPISTIAKRAEIRNRSFAEKLGIVYPKQ